MGKESYFLKEYVFWNINDKYLNSGNAPKWEWPHLPQAGSNLTYTNN